MAANGAAMENPLASISSIPEFGHPSSALPAEPKPQPKTRRYSEAPTSSTKNAAAPPQRRKSMIEAFHSPEFQEALRKAEIAKHGEFLSSSFNGSSSMGLEDAVMDDEVANLVSQASASLRQGFVRKVMGLFILQLALTAGVAAAIATSPEAVTAFVDNPAWLFGLWCAAVAILIVFACVPGLIRQWPSNMICLVLFTAVQGVLVGLTAAVFHSSVLLVAITSTASACACVALVTLVEGCGLSASIGASLSMAVTITTFGVAGAIGILSSWGGIIGGILVSCLFCVFIVMDVQAIIGGNHRSFDFELDEAVLAALCLYTDIIGLFMYAIACAAGSAARGSG